MSKYHDDSTYATLPGEISLDLGKLKVFKREWGWLKKLLVGLPFPDDLLDEHLHIGCCNPAVVIQTEPELIISAYSGDHDWVLLLKFSPFFVQEYSLKPMMRLLTVNTYGQDPSLACDLENGPNSTHTWTNFFPMIAEFCSSDVDTINEKKQEIEEDDEAEYQRTYGLGWQLLSEGRIIPRKGNPYYSFRPQPPRH